MASLPLPARADRLSLPRLAAEADVSPVSVWRWAMRGVAGIRLPTVCIGRRRYTSWAAYEDWCQRVTAARDGEILGRRETPRQRERAIDQAEREATRLGV